MWIQHLLVDPCDGIAWSSHVVYVQFISRHLPHVLISSHSLAYISVSLLRCYRVLYKLNHRTSRINQVSADEPLVISIDSPPDLRRRPKNDLRLVFLPAPTTCVVPFALSFGL